MLYVCLRVRKSLINAMFHEVVEEIMCVVGSCSHLFVFSCGPSRRLRYLRLGSPNGALGWFLGDL